MLYMDLLERIRAVEHQTVESLNDALGLILALEDSGEIVTWCRWVRSEARRLGTAEALEVIRKAYFLSGRYNFDDFMVAMEWNREPNARFWLPRRKVLEGKHGIATKIQAFMDDKDALFLGFSQPPGTGKQLSDDTRILTRDGWKNHGALTVGDEVIGMNGEFVKVTHVFPKAKQNCRVYFSDGTHIDCHENHEWVVFDRATNSERIVETKFLEKVRLDSGTPGKRGHRYRFMVPKHGYVVGNDKEFPVPPYTMGAWLGDGTTKKPAITIHPKDRCIADAIVMDGYRISAEYEHEETGCATIYFAGLRNDLEKMGLCHSRKRWDKYLPPEYLTASVEQRLDLLAGMIDTDGTRFSDNKYEFSTSEEAVKEAFVVLVSTFGWRTCVIKEDPHTSSFGITGRKPTWRVSFTPDCVIPCRVPRKQVVPMGVQRRVSITKVARTAEKTGNCIEVEGGVYLAGHRLVPTHNSTLIKFFLAYIIGREPKSANMYISYSDGMTKMLLDSVKSMLTDTVEYCFHEIFPGLGEPAISAEYKTVSYRRAGDFPTLGLVSLSGSVTGRTRANRFLVTDDLVKNKEEARSPERLEKLYADYTATLTTRMIGDNVKQIMLGTRWSSYDPLGRMQDAHLDDPRYTFISIPVWDENCVSNFEYDHPDRYTTEKIRDIKATIDSADFECLFMQHGIEKEGLAFPADSLNYYNGVLPDGEPDNICFVNDVAWGGGDSLSMPIAYVYGGDVYIHDWLFDRRDKSVTKPRCIGKILQHKIKMGRTESNNGGDEYSDDVYRVLRQDHGYSINMSHKKAPTNMAKLTRIEQYAPDIRRFYFRADACRDDDYRRAMNELTSFSFTSKNLHDDAADSLAMMADYLTSGIKSVSIGRRPF